MERGALTPAVRRATRPARWQLAAGSLGSQLLSRDLAAVLAARIDALPADARVGAARRGRGRRHRAGRRDRGAARAARPAGDARPGAVAAVELERAVDELLQRRMLHRVRGGFAFARR